MQYVENTQLVPGYPYIDERVKNYALTEESTDYLSAAHYSNAIFRVRLNISRLDNNGGKKKKKKTGKTELSSVKAFFAREFKWTKRDFAFESARKIDSIKGKSERGKRKENVERGAGEDLEATQFPLTAGVFLESIYRSPPPLVVSCRGNRTRSLSFSLSRRMSHSLPDTRRHARAAAARAHASTVSLEFSTRCHAGNHKRYSLSASLSMLNFESFNVNQ